MCSAIVKQEYNTCVDRTREEFEQMRPGSKAWWTKSKEIQTKKTKVLSIPPLKTCTGEWTYDGKEKADLIGETLTSKYNLPIVETNAFSDVGTNRISGAALPLPSMEDLTRLMQELDENSATGPDLIPSRIFKKFSAELTSPV